MVGLTRNRSIAVFFLPPSSAPPPTEAGKNADTRQSIQLDRAAKDLEDKA